MGRLSGTLAISNIAGDGVHPVRIIVETFHEVGALTTGGKKFIAVFHRNFNRGFEAPAPKVGQKTSRRLCEI